MSKWKIYYGDGSTFSNEDGEPSLAPTTNVQVVVCQPWVWQEGDLFGLYDYLMQPGLKVVKFGRTIESSKYQEIANFARSDPYFDRSERYVNEMGDYYWYVGE